LLDELKKIGVDFELWINGSFATKKPDPNDIDIAAFFSPDQVNSIPDDKKHLLVSFYHNPDDIKIRYHCDTYMLANVHQKVKEHWGKLFGSSKQGIPKGIPKLSIKAMV